MQKTPAWRRLLFLRVGRSGSRGIGGEVDVEDKPRKVYAFELETSLGTLNFTGISVEQYLTLMHTCRRQNSSSTATQSDNDGAVQMNLWDYIEVIIGSKNNMSIHNLRSKVRFAGAATYDRTDEDSFVCRKSDDQRRIRYVRECNAVQVTVWSRGGGGRTLSAQFAACDNADGTVSLKRIKTSFTEYCRGFQQGRTSSGQPKKATKLDPKLDVQKSKLFQGWTAIEVEFTGEDEATVRNASSAGAAKQHAGKSRSLYSLP